MSVLDDAAKLVAGDRQSEYGTPGDSMRAIAEHWTSYLRARFGVSAPLLQPRDAAAMMLEVKIARIASGRLSRDSLVDVAGYVRVLEIVGE
jgi:hypothetical protein